MAQKTTNSLITKVMQLQKNAYISNTRDNLIFWPKDILTMEIKSLKHMPPVPTIFGNVTTINMLKYLKGRNTHLCNMVTSVCKQFEQYKEETNDNINHYKNQIKLQENVVHKLEAELENVKKVNKKLLISIEKNSVKNNDWQII
jgi:hypothetical protein